MDSGIAWLISAGAAGTAMNTMTQILNLFGQGFTIRVDNLFELEKSTMLIKLTLFHVLIASESGKATAPEALRNN
jgi:hypothetical protein